MDLKQLVERLTPAFKRQALYERLWECLHSADEPVKMVVFCGSRGSGKKSLLENIAYQASRLELEIESSYLCVTGAPLEQLRVDIKSWIAGVETGKIKILLMDCLDDLLRREASGSEFFDFELDPLLDLCIDENTFIFITSQIVLNQWREYDIREAHVNIQIPPLSLDEVSKIAKENGLEPQNLFSLTLGHTRAIQEELEHPNYGERELASWAVRYFLAGLDQSTRMLAEVASQMPVFDTQVLGNALSKRTGQLSTHQMNQSIDQLLGLGMVYWDTGFYRFRDSAVRGLIARHLYWEEPDHFHEIHQVAAEYFQAGARYPSYLQDYIVSAIYHQAQANRARGQTAVGQECLSWAQERTPAWLGADGAEVMKAWESGGGDALVKTELIELIGFESYDQITDLINQVQTI